MKLKAIKFCRFKGQKYEWSMEGKPENGIYNQPVTFQNINLIVGKNATGKSKTVDVIRRLADLLAGEINISDIEYENAIFEVVFDDNGQEIYYYLEFIDHKVIQEKLLIGTDTKLDREKRELYYAEIEKNLSFEIQEDKLVVSRVDNKQQPFFNSLQQWGKNLNHYRFGTHLGRQSLFGEINIDVIKKQEISLKTNDKVLITFVKGMENPYFENIIIQDMKKVGYNLLSIGYGKYKIRAFGFEIQEQDIEGITPQIDVSQGMFRALSLLIQLNYSLLSQIPSCILIDDIGEGLDYERSKSLIDLIIEKVKDSPVQVIMTTNDRFVMNKIPLEYWSVIHRTPKKSLFYNYQNSKEIFDDFKYSGLSNFDFLRTEFYTTGFEIEENTVTQ
ncbi:MAG: ATP-binding protein [Cytophagales bacterium]|nr:MAG: ATP-binding protein [Cytophagales bacterium]